MLAPASYSTVCVCALSTPLAPPRSLAMQVQQVRHGTVAEDMLVGGYVGLKFLKRYEVSLCPAEGSQASLTHWGHAVQSWAPGSSGLGLTHSRGTCGGASAYASASASSGCRWAWTHSQTQRCRAS